MTDLYLGIAAMVILGMASFHATRRLVSDCPRWVYDVLAVLTVLLLLVYIRWWWNDPRLTLILPYSNLIIIGNWFLPLIGVLAGLAWGRLANWSGRRWATIALLFTVGTYSTLSPVLGKPPACADQWEGDLCLQSTDSTCSPAAAATLLRHYGIPASEQEMAELCLTRGGTTWLGLYRGLKLKTEGTPWDVEMIQVAPASAEQLPQGPMILCAMLDPQSASLEDYQGEWGWIPGVPHSVVYMHQARDGSFRMVDPYVGVENWSRKDVNVLWQGQGIRLIRRGTSDPVFSLDQFAVLALGESR